MIIIYCHTSPNGKRYIGRTSSTITVRSGKNGNKYKQNTSFYSDIKKFGWDKFIHEILDECDSVEKAMELEIYYIHKFDSSNPEKGYNKSIGGYPCNKGLTADEKKQRHYNAVKKWIRSNKERFLATNRKRECTPEYRAKKNEYNKTDARRKHRTEYMRLYREKNRDEYNRKRREYAARKREESNNFRGHETTGQKTHCKAEVV